jgi:hypothetical protein
VARPSDARVEVRPGVRAADLSVGPRSDVRPGCVRSYLSDGRDVQWRPPCLSQDVRWAIDAEIADQPVPAALAARTGVSDPAGFWPAWTAAEVTAKLLDVPMVMWLAAYGLSVPAAADRGVTLHALTWSGLAIAIGRLSVVEQVVGGVAPVGRF